MRLLSVAVRSIAVLLVAVATAAGAASIPGSGPTDAPATPPAPVAPLKTLAPNAGIT